MPSEIFYGIALAWTVLALYVVSLANRQRRLSREIARLKETIGSGN
jgi:CcmD family protein